ncbi:MAG: hypothetical protein JST84_02300 [Acidobacteria bacterium]|nr:hypothetical protein [Acidobacteriota bacterium]
MLYRKTQSFPNLASRLVVLTFLVFALGSSLFLSVRGAMNDVPIGGYEGDVSTRTNAGKGAVGITDWVLIGRFVSGVETPKAGAEFQRADVAPKESKGDGQMTVADWVQAGRYATGVDPLVGAGGPTGPLGASPARPEAARDLRIVQTSIVGSTLNLSLEYEAVGNENAFGFSVNFDPAALGTPSAAIGSGVSGGTLLFNNLQAAQGRLGFAIALPSPNTVSAGVRQLATLSFTILKVGLNTQLSYGNQPVGIEIVGADTTVLPAPDTSATTIVTINNTIPTLTGIAPTSATAGGATFALTVNGTNFNDTTIVNWNGVARPTTLVNSTQVTATISAADISTAGNANVTVTNPAPGGATTSALNFTINNPVPTLTSIDPASVIAGSAGFTLTLNGTGFVNASIAQVNGVNRSTSFVNPTKLTINLAAAEIANAGTLNITVTNLGPGGGTTGAQTLTINNPLPTLTSLSQTSATTGSAGFILTVNGTNFVSTSKVRWNGVDRATTFVSSTQLTATIPASDLSNGGTAEVTVFNPTPGGGTTAASTFTINNPTPTITSLSPNNIATGNSTFTLTVNGTGFVPNSVVRWNGENRVTTFVSSTQVTAQILASDVTTAGTAKVRVFNPTPAGGLSGEVDFTILQTNPVPTLASINPPTVIVGGAQFTLTVSGTNFVGSSVVRVNGSDRTTTFVSATELKATITASDIANTGTVAITVFNPTPGGGTTSSLNLAINNPVPTITTLSQTSILKDSASFTLTVNGTNFISTSKVKWNGTDRATTVVNATQLNATILASDLVAAGTANITVANPSPGGGTSNTAVFTINNPLPTLTSLDPPSTYNTLPAFTLTVKGTGFVGPNGSVVRWNGTDRSTTFVSSTELKAAITAADIADFGTAVVTVFNPTPGGGTSNALNFTIEKLTGYEGDVAPRPLGNNDGKVTIQDWVQAGRFFVGLDKAALGSEFQRVDCAPKETKGDGKITITDWVQTGRYASGMDAVVVAGGPIQPAPGLPGASPVIEAFAPEAQRTIRAASASFRRDQVNTLRIELDSVGDENALSFSLNYDARLLRFLDATAGEGAGGANISINRTELATGRVGLALAMPVGQSIVAGTRTVLNVRFMPLAGDGETTTQISFGDSLVPRELANAYAQGLPAANYANATITLAGRAAANVIAANYLGGELAADSIASVFSTNLALSTEAANGDHLPILLGGSQVKITDSKGREMDAPLFFVSPNQINYQIPSGLAEGIATVTITNRDGVETKGLLNISGVAPGIFSADATGKGVAAAEVIYVRPDNSQVRSVVARFDATAGRFLANPIDVSNDPAFLTLYATGLRNRSSLANVKVLIAGIEAQVEYAGPQGQFIGLDQINVRLPKALAGRGEVTIELIVDDKAANPVRISMK